LSAQVGRNAVPTTCGLFSLALVYTIDFEMQEKIKAHDVNSMAYLESDNHEESNIHLP
jgi:hypothetical protein